MVAILSYKSTHVAIKCYVIMGKLQGTILYTAPSLHSKVQVEATQVLRTVYNCRKDFYIPNRRNTLENPAYHPCRLGK